MPRKAIVPTDMIIRAMAECQGDTRKAALILDMEHKTLEQRIWREERLRSLYGTKAPQVDLVEQETRAPLALPDKDQGTMMAKIIETQDIDLLHDGLKKAGISDATLQKLRDLRGMSADAGRFLVNSLSLSHQMMVYQSVSLMEEADYIKATYLRDAALDPEVKAFWQRCYNDICDLIGKTFDRTLAGTQAMVAINSGRGNSNKKPQKPGPVPLNQKPKEQS